MRRDGGYPITSKPSITVCTTGETKEHTPILLALFIPLGEATWRGGVATRRRGSEVCVCVRACACACACCVQHARWLYLARPPRRQEHLGHLNGRAALQHHHERHAVHHAVPVRVRGRDAGKPDVEVVGAAHHRAPRAPRTGRGGFGLQGGEWRVPDTAVGHGEKKTGEKKRAARVRERKQEENRKADRPTCGQANRRRKPTPCARVGDGGMRVRTCVCVCVCVGAALVALAAGDRNAVTGVRTLKRSRPDVWGAQAET